MKYWTFLFVLGFSFPSCIGERRDTYFLRNDLVGRLMYIPSCITGKKKEIDSEDNIAGEKPSERNFSEAHALFSEVEKILREAPTITKYSIAQSTLIEINEILGELKQHIEGLPDGQEKNQFKKEWHQLAQYVSSLMTKKNV